MASMAAVGHQKHWEHTMYPDYELFSALNAQRTKNMIYDCSDSESHLTQLLFLSLCK